MTEASVLPRQALPVRWAKVIDHTREAYAEWLTLARPAARHSPDGTRRPYWLLRPLKPGREAFRLPGSRARP